METVANSNSCRNISISYLINRNFAVDTIQGRKVFKGGNYFYEEIRYETIPPGLVHPKKSAATSIVLFPSLQFVIILWTYHRPRSSLFLDEYSGSQYAKAGS